jgi:hypothetical protein
MSEAVLLEEEKYDGIQLLFTVAEEAIGDIVIFAVLFALLLG